MIAIPIDKPKSCEECKFESAQYVNNYCRRAFCSLGADYEHCPLIEIDLVRCGECKYHDEDGWGYGNCQRPYVDHLRTADEDFCSYGERESEDFDPYQGERDRDENGEIY